MTVRLDAWLEAVPPAVLARLRSARDVLVVSHENPDADTLGVDAVRQRDLGHAAGVRRERQDEDAPLRVVARALDHAPDAGICVGPDIAQRDFAFNNALPRMLCSGRSGLTNILSFSSLLLIFRMIFDAKCAATNSVNERGHLDISEP